MKERVLPDQQLPNSFESIRQYKEKVNKTT